MPELPEIVAYIDALERRLVGRVLERIRIRTPSVLRTYDPKVSELEGKRVAGLRRMGKRVVLEMDDDLFAVIHLMISGRFQWKKRGALIPRKRAHAAFDFPNGILLLAEASSHKRASLHVVRGEEALSELDPGGIEPLEAGLESFREALFKENRTLKRALTDPRVLSGIGNAHSDEILLKARLSPVKRTRQLDEEEVEELFEATRSSLAEWVDRLREESGEDFPKTITAFHPSMGAHGKQWRAVPPLRGADPAHRLRGEGDQLLRALPNGGEAPQGSSAVPSSPGGLAQDSRGARRGA